MAPEEAGLRSCFFCPCAVHSEARNNQACLSIRYSRCMRDGCIIGSRGCRKSSRTSVRIPSLCITASERRLAGIVNATICGRCSAWNPKSKAQCAASLTYPFPHSAGASRQATSTAGVKCASNPTCIKPTSPANSATSGISSAHGPKPNSSKWASIRSAKASLSERVSGAGKCCMATGSPLRSANGPRSVGRHGRSSTRGPLRRAFSGARSILILRL